MTDINLKFFKSLKNAQRRCNDPANNRYQYYGARGIKCLLAPEDILFLAWRDRAEKMKKPQLHRLNPKKHYTIQNTIFLEAAAHSRITHLGKKRSKASRQRMSEAGGTQFGEGHPLAILKLSQVKYILRSKLRGIELAKKYSVSKSTISAIQHRRVWAWVI